MAVAVDDNESVGKKPNNGWNVYSTVTALPACVKLICEELSPRPAAEPVTKTPTTQGGFAAHRAASLAM